MSTINIVLGDKFYTKDPQTTELGQRIVNKSVLLIDELGFEGFTFKKLASKIDSTEASIYRYFDNKLMLLLYLTTWYWAWVEYMIDYHTHHINDAKDKLDRIWEIVCHVNVSSATDVPLDILPLRRVVMLESDKTYLTKEVDRINQQGLFKGFKGLCHKISMAIESVNPNYEHGHSLVSMMMETSHQQAFFAEHLPSLTEINGKTSQEINHKVSDFIKSTVRKVID